MDRTTLKLSQADLRRDITFTREAVNVEKRSIELSFSSEEPVERWYGYEILDHKGSSCDLSRLNNRAPLLLNHNTDEQIGVVERAWVKDGKGYAEVRFGKGKEAEECFQDVQDGIRSKISVGYRVRSVMHESTQDGHDTYRVTDWQPYEISIVSVPADDSVGVGRSDTNHQTEIPIIMNRNLKLAHGAEGGGAAAPAAPSGVEVNVAEVSKAERARISEIGKLARTFSVPEADLNRFIDEGLSVADFKSHILATRASAKPVETESPLIGMTGKEVKRYSLLRAISRLASGQQLDGLEKEASDACAKRNKRDPEGFFIPHDIATRSIADSQQMSAGDVVRALAGMRALNVTTPTAGGFTVGTDVLGSNLIELLRNKTMVSMMGASSLSGLTGNIAIPKVAGGATAYWLSESGSITSSDQSFGQLGLTPKRLGAATAYTKQLIAQSSISVEAFVRNDLMAVLALEKDRAAINGLGAAGEPLGLLNTTGINTVTFGAAPTWAKVVDFETEVAADNADYGTMGFLTTAQVRGAFKKTPKVSGQAIFLWEGDQVNGYRAEVSQQVPSNRVIFANWANLILADWDGMDVVVDPYTLAATGQVKITIQLLTDNAVRHPVSFCVSTDSGAQ